jgi:hypothetical protein
MPWWSIELISVLIAGAIGGILNALILDGGFKNGIWQTLNEEQKIYRPGWGGNVLIGMVAAFVIWVLYGTIETASVKDLLRQIGGSVLVGVGGSRVILKEIDNRILGASKDELTKALQKKRTIKNGN